MVVVPATETFTSKPRLITEKYKPLQIWLESAISQAYLSNADRVEVQANISEPGMSEKIEQLRRKLYGFKVEERTSNRLVISFVDASVQPIEEILDRGYRSLTGIYFENKSIMSELPKVTNIDGRRATVVSNEDDADQNAMLGKRLLNRALLDPETSAKLGIGGVQEVLVHDTLLTSLERVTDLQVELFKLSCDLPEELAKGKASKIFPFTKYPTEYAFASYFDNAVSHGQGVI